MQSSPRELCTDHANTDSPAGTRPSSLNVTAAVIFAPALTVSGWGSESALSIPGQPRSVRAQSGNRRLLSGKTHSAQFRVLDSPEGSVTHGLGHPCGSVGGFHSLTVTADVGRGLTGRAELWGEPSLQSPAWGTHRTTPFV